MTEVRKMIMRYTGTAGTLITPTCKCGSTKIMRQDVFIYKDQKHRCKKCWDKVL